MPSTIYELVAMGARYFFAFLSVLIVVRSVIWLRADAKRSRRAVRRLPDAGMVGEMVNEATGVGQPLPREGVLGAARDCDVRVTGEGVLGRHTAFAFVDGEGVRFTPILGGVVFVNDEPLSPDAALTHGARFEVGSVRLRIRLFEGLNVPSPASFCPDPGDADAQARESEWGYAPYPVEAMRGYFNEVRPLDETVRMPALRADDAAQPQNPFEDGGPAGHGRQS